MNDHDSGEPENDAPPPLPGIAIGRHEHADRGACNVLGVARHSETLEPLAVYRCVTDDSLWAEALASFERAVDAAPTERRWIATVYDLPALPQLEPGRYQHVDGGVYVLVGTGWLADSLEAVVVYRSLADEGLWARPLPMFEELVAGAGGRVPRFRRLGR